METIKIEIPDGHEVESFDKQSGVIRLKVKPKNILERIKTQLSVTERIKSIDDAITELGEADEEVIRYKKILTVLTDPADHLVNYQAAVLLVRAINEKREPEWADGSELKYTNYFIMGGSSGFRFGDCAYWSSGSFVGSRLCFFNPDHGRYLAEQFPDVFKNFMLIVKQ